MHHMEGGSPRCPLGQATIPGIMWRGSIPVHMGGISAPMECLRDRRNRDVLGPKLEMELKFPHPRGTKMHLECY